MKKTSASFFQLAAVAAVFLVSDDRGVGRPDAAGNRHRIGDVSRADGASSECGS